MSADARLNPDRATRVQSTERQIAFFRVSAFCLAVAGVVSVVVLLSVWGVPSAPEDIATSIGIAGTFWALAGLVLVYVAFLGQQVELQYNAQAIADQQEEIRLNREELAGQREQLEQQAGSMREQVDALRRQNYESTFFELARVYRDTVAQTIVVTTTRSQSSRGAPIKKKTTEHRGAHGHRQMVATLSVRLRGGEKNVLRANMLAPRVEGTEDRGRLDAAGIKAAYDVMYEGHEDYIGLTFQALEAVLDFADQFPNSRLYASIVASQVSVNLREILFYHVWTGTATPRLREFVLKYGLLDEVGPDDIVEPYHAEVLGAVGQRFGLS